MMKEAFVSRFGGLLIRLQPGRYGEYELLAEVIVRFEGGRIEVDPAVAAAMRAHYLFGQEFWAEEDLQQKAIEAARNAAAQQLSQVEEKASPDNRIEALYQKLVEAGVDPAELQTNSGRVSAAKVVRAAQRLGIE